MASLRRFPARYEGGRTGAWIVSAGEASDLGDWLARVLAGGADAGLGPFDAEVRGAPEACRYALETAGIVGCDVRGPRAAVLLLQALPVETATALIDAWTSGLELSVTSAARPDEFALQRAHATRSTVRVPDAGRALTAALSAAPIVAGDGQVEQVAAPGALPRARRASFAAAAAAVVVAVVVGVVAVVRHGPQVPPVASSPAGTLSGFDTPPVPSASAIAPDPATGGFFVVGCCDEPRDGMPRPAATWEWDGSSWDHLHPVLSPAYSRDMTLGFDTSAATFVLHGGETAPQTWTWDRHHGTWQLESDAIQPPVGPAGIVGQTATPPRSFTPFVLVTGGQLATVQTWWRTFNGWRLADASGPPAFVALAVAPDVARGNLVLVSSRDGTSEAQTSVFDRGRWSPVSTPRNLPFDPNTQLTWDAASQRVLAILPGASGFVGSGSSGTTETWAWNGTAWAQVESQGGPGGRGRLLTSWLGVVLFMSDAATDGRPDVMTWTGTRWDAHPGGAAVVLRNPPSDAGTLLRAHGLVLLGGPLRGDVDQGKAADAAAHALPQPVYPESLRTATVVLGTIQRSDTGAGLCTCWVWEVLRTSLPTCPALEVVESEAIILVDAGSNQVVRVLDDPAPPAIAFGACG